MNSHEQSLILRTKDDVNEIKQFLVAYLAFCQKYGYIIQMRYTSLVMIEDVLIQAATRAHGALPCTLGVSEAFSQWDDRVTPAKMLYKQAYHLNRRLKKMTDDSLANCRRHYYDRSLTYRHEIPREEPQLVLAEG